MADWKELTRLTQGAKMLVERVRLASSDIAIEGSFELPPLAQLPFEDQVFIAQFVKCHGSIKEIERLFGISYPTVKNRLNRISESLGLPLEVQSNPAPTRAEILDKLERGEISAKEAAKELSK